MNRIYHLVKLPIFFVLVFMSYQLLQQERQLQKIEQYNAYQRDASRGIFNVNAWRCHLVDVVDKKIQKTNLKALAQMITKEIQVYYQKHTLPERKGKLWDYDSKTSFWGNMGNFASKSYGKVKTKVLDYALEKGSHYLHRKVGENSKALQEVLASKTTQFIKDSLKDEATAKQSQGVDSECQAKPVVLKSTKDINKDKKELLLIFWFVIFFLFFMLALLYKRQESLKKWVLMDASILALILLVLGILLPMMEINATLLDLKIKLLGEDIIFANQSLYFRSKSIYDIVVILLPVNPMIGIAVMAFSVILPLMKLVATFMILLSKKPKEKLKWFITHLGKWSMADVFLVAIFLANLSFQNILSEQLEPLAKNEQVDLAINTSHSSIQIGFYFFFAYVILSMIIAKLTKSITD